MTKNRYASVAVFRPIPSTFEYTVPRNLANSVEEGTICLVPFREELERGIVLDVNLEPSYEGPRKPIKEIISHQPLQKSLIELARWLSYSTLTPLGQVFNRMIPPDTTSVPRSVKKIKLEKSFGEVHEYIEGNEKKAPKQAELLECLLSADEPIIKKELLKRANSSSSPLRALQDKGIVGEISRPEIEKREAVIIDKTERDFPDLVSSIKKDIDELPGSFGKYATYETGDERLAIYLEIVRSITAGSGTVLILAPSVIRAEELTELIGESLDLVTLSYHSDLTGGELSQRWNLARTGEVDVFVGVLSAAYLPVSPLGGIIVEGEGNRNYELKEQDPKGNLVETSLKRAELEDVPVILGGSSPSVRSYLRLKQGEFCQLGQNFPSGLDRSANLSTEVTTRQSGEDGLSEGLRRALKRNYDEGGSAVIIGEKTGASSAAICENCDQVIRCSDCKVPLIYRTSGNLGICPYCGTRQDLLVCPNCGSDDIKFIGGGLEKTEQEIDSLLPGAKVRRFDSQKESWAKFSGLFARVLEGDIDVLLGTSLISSLYLNASVPLVGLLDLDILLNRPTYRSTELLWERILSGYGLVKPGGKLFFQGFRLNQFPFKLIESGSWKELYEMELGSRRKLGYPPFKELIEVQVQGVEEDGVKKDLAELRGRLEDLGAGIEVISSVDGGSGDKKGRIRSSLMVKAEKLEVFLDEINREIQESNRERLRLNPFS
ncbi:MAG: hypothetical protein V5A83_01260 [Candidatus Bipolaricaulota bacterium]